MILRRMIRSHHYQTLVQLKWPPQNRSAIPHSIPSNLIQYLCANSILYRPFSLSAHFKTKEDPERISLTNVVGENKRLKKPLNIYFKEAVGLLKKSEDFESESENENGNGELKKRLRKLEEEVRSLRKKKKDEKENLKNKEQRKKEETNNCKGLLKNESEKKEGIKKDEGLLKNEPKQKEATQKDEGLLKNESKTRALSSLFANKVGLGGKKLKELKMENPEGHDDEKLKKLKMENPEVYKELSPDMQEFVIHLYKNGYFKDSNFLPRRRFDITCFENSYARDFIKFAAELFGKDNQQVAKWLSGSDLKKVAQFGCPSLGRKTVFSAKNLRRFFSIQENTVCDKCVLKESCKFVNQSVWKGDRNNLDLAVVMRVITLYALESLPPQLVVPEEVKASVNRLLKEAVNLSQTVP